VSATVTLRLPEIDCHLNAQGVAVDRFKQA
jgi:hypothetical protein